MAVVWMMIYFPSLVNFLLRPKEIGRYKSASRTLHLLGSWRWCKTVVYFISLSYEEVGCKVAHRIRYSNVYFKQEKNIMVLDKRVLHFRKKKSFKKISLKRYFSAVSLFVLVQYFLILSCFKVLEKKRF